MRSLLTVISDESLLNRIKLALNDNTIKYYYSTTGEEASNIASREEIAVVIVDFINPVISGPEICEMLLSFNPETQFIMFFDEKYTKEVLNVYNALHLNKLICKEHLVLEDLPSLVESCLHTYNRDEELDKMDEDLAKMNDMYLRPMNEMSSILNERLIGYENVIKVFKNSVNYIINNSDEVLKSVDTFVDRIINDYIQIFMIKEPQVSVYFDRINESFNDPEGRKYFKFVYEDTEFPEELKYNLLFVLDVITIFFDIFYQYYRGKVSVGYAEGNNSWIEINAIYEVRKNQEIAGIYEYVSKVINNILSMHTLSTRFGQKNSIIQFKALIGQNEEGIVQ